MKNKRLLRLYRYLPTGLTLLLGGGLTLAATLGVGRWERLTRQNEFEKQTNNLTTALQRTTNRYSELLYSLGDFYQATDNQVSETAFQRFVHRALGSYPGIQALEWAPVISQQERPHYEQGLRENAHKISSSCNELSDGRSTQPCAPRKIININMRNRHITERNTNGALMAASVRDRYVPVTYIEPWQTNEAALGYDLASDQTRRIALEHARDTGAIAATGRVQLVQETAQNQYGFLVFLPVYSQSVQTLESRRQHIEGYLLGVFRVADVIEESLENLNYDMAFCLFDRTARPDAQFLGFYDATLKQVITQPNPGQQTAFVRQNPCSSSDIDGETGRRTMRLGQREWQVVFLHDDLNSGLQPFPWATLATAGVGLMMTASLLMYQSRWQAELMRTRELSDLKLRLFSMASHELRTPLSVILVSAQSLSANQEVLSPANQASTLERIQTAARRMRQLVSDILTLTRAEAGKLEFAPKILELEPFCQQVVDEAQGILKPDQHIVLTIPSQLPPVYLDTILLRSILCNLLSNAAKYSPEGSKIHLTIRCCSEMIELQVSDSGVGIPLKAQNQIFEAFYRAENAAAIQGSGLGLAVVKTCTELHGGELTVASIEHQGTTITVRLPRIH